MIWALALAAGYAAGAIAAIVLILAVLGHLVFLWARSRLPELPEGKQAFFDAPSGARICYVVHGDRSKAKQYVVYFSGLFGSRREHFGARFPEDPTHCVVTLDRPGYGLSSFLPRPARSYRQTGADVVALMRSIGVGEFSVLGWSSGGPYALACALEGGDAVTSCVTVAADPPWGDVPRSLPNRVHAVLLVLVRRMSPLVGPLLWLLSRLLVLFVWLRKPRSVPGVVEPVRGGVRGTADEMRMERAAWGFALGDLGRTHVHVVHGTRDTMVPVAAAEYTHARLPSSVLLRLDGLGHGVVRSLWPHLVRLAAEPGPDAVALLRRAASDLRAARSHQKRVAAAMRRGDVAAVAAEVRRRTGAHSDDVVAEAAGRASLAYQ